MIKKLLSFIISIIFLSSCSDSFDLYPSGTVSPEGDIQFTIDIPGPVIHTSRSETGPDPEYLIDDIWVIIYQGEADSGTPSQTVRLYADNSLNPSPCRLEPLEIKNRLRIKFRLDESLRQKSGLRFYFIANSKESEFPFTESELKAQMVDAVKTETAGGELSSLVMCGSVRQADLSATGYVPLYRNAAKVTVSNMVPTDNPAGLEIYPHSLYGDAVRSPRMAFYTTDENLTEAQEYAPDKNDLPATEASFFHPTRNACKDNGIGGKLFLIIKAGYEGKDYFYRLDFVDKDKDGKDCYINAKPNHWYQFVILDILCAGYDNPAEAALHPYNGVKYEIHDHSPVSYNMASDGFRELGLSHVIEYSGHQNVGDEWSDKELYIKFFSKDPDEEPAAEDVLDLVSVDDPSWLELSDPELVTDGSSPGVTGSYDEYNDAGKVYRLRLRFLMNDELGALENKITVSWKGLKRETPVIWARNFSGAEVTSASLTMMYNGSQTVGDYWSFLSSADEPSDDMTDALWGIRASDNNGKIRNRGFHFPVMYGGYDNPATYSYDLTFDKLNKLRKENVDEVIVKVGDDRISCTENPSGEYYSYTITRDNNDGYDYIVGNLNFTFIFKDGSKQDYSFQTYHTGFFHKDSQSHRLDAQDPDNFYYYEVVPVTVDGKPRYILDRNLAAKSAEMYVRDEYGNTALGNPDAAGGYFTVAFQKFDDAGNNTYNDPVLFDDTDDRVSPPGYRVPLKNAWVAIRASAYFHNEAVEGKFPAYYDSPDPRIGKVYFPKSMLYMYDSANIGSIKGDARSGYYWTGTAATGTEKDEIGKWLNMFMLTGSSTSYVNGCVMTNVPYLEYGASVRCINDIPDNSTVSLTSFNVTGATNVFLYKEDSNGVRTPTTAWPGHSIGNFATMTDGRWFGFSFESTQFTPEELYVIFNFVDKDGIIYTYSCDKNDGSTILSTDLTPSECVGWKVIGDHNSNIVPPGNVTTDNIDLMPSAVTALKNWWRCGGRTAGNPYVYDYKLAPKTLFMIGDATAGDWDYNSVTPIAPDPLNQNIYTWEGPLKKGEMKATFSLLRDARFWSADFFRPVVDKTQISSAGLTDSPMGEWKEDSKHGVPDNKWYVARPGNYRLTFNINDMKFSAECLEGTIKITVTNTKGWPNVYLYYWDSEGDNYGHNWPGTKMIQDPENENRYYLEIPESAEFIIFNDGGSNQTGDIDLTLTGKYDFDSIP